MSSCAAVPFMVSIISQVRHGEVWAMEVRVGDANSAQRRPNHHRRGASVRTDGLGSVLGCGEPLLKIRQDVIDELDADSQSHQTRRHS